MNAKLFVALTIFLFLFSITSYSPENYAFAESEYKTQENPQTVVSPFLSKTRWKGPVNWNSTWVDVETVKCSYEGNVTLNLNKQQGNVVTGNGKINKVKVKGHKRCDRNFKPEGAVSFIVDTVESSFSGTVNNGELSIKDGRFTSDMMAGSFSGEVGVITVSGSFTIDKVSKR